MRRTPRRRRLLASTAAAICVLQIGCGADPPETHRGTAPPGHSTLHPVDRALRGLVFEDDRVRLARPEEHARAGEIDVREALRRAEREVYAGRTSRALETLVDAVAAAPRSAEVYAALGETLLRAGHQREALTALRHALDLDPGHEQSLYHLGLARQSMGRRAEAVATWQELLERNPEHGAAHRRLAAALYLEGDRQAARRHLRRAQALGEAPPAHLEARLDGRVQRQGRPRRKGVTAPVLGPEVGVDSGPPSFATEPAVAVSPAPDQVLVSWFETVVTDVEGSEVVDIRLHVGQSFDDGRSFDELAVETPISDRTSEADPFLAADRSTGSVWVSGISFPRGGIWVAHRPPGSTRFGEPVFAIVDDEADKPLMAITEAPFFFDERRLFLVHNQGLQMSEDEGRTWTAPVPLGGFNGYHPVVNSRGWPYVLFSDASGGIRLTYSTDGGRTFVPAVAVAERLDFWGRNGDHEGRFPSDFRITQFPALAVDVRDDALYCVFIDTTAVVDGQSDVDVYFSRSTDLGRTWSVPAILNQAGVAAGDQLLPWLHADDTGRLHAAYYDTRHGNLADGSETALLDVYYAYSEDRGDSWTEIRLTPESFSTASAWYSEREFIGDYIGISSRTTAGATRVFVTYMSTAGGDSDIYLRTIDFGNAGGAETCEPDAASLCLLDSRFRVRAEWKEPRGQSGTGGARKITSDTGYFWFFSPDNVEVTVKVLDGCGFNDRIWVFAAGMTNVGVRMTVEDTRTGEVVTFENPLGEAFRPIQDTAAFATCGAR